MDGAPVADAGPWHAGELAAQARAGGPPGSAIRSFMPDQHRLFFAQLPYVVTATVDDDMAPVATVLVGGEGFMASPDPKTLAVAAARRDPAAEHLTAGSPAAFLGIQLDTRRRNRANGRIAYDADAGLIVDVLQSFGNCPQYIHPRQLAVDPAAAGTGVERFEGFDAAARAQVTAADTFFVATGSGPKVANGGVDISHRGGPPGFVAIDGDELVIPDYRGNHYFNTLGNLVLEPRAALLFLDLDAGTMLQLQGPAEVLWDDAGLPNAERVWRFRPERGFRANSGLRT